MSAVLEEYTVPFDAILDGPALSHYQDVFKNAMASLCGAPVLGIPAPDSAPLCADCARIWEGLFA